MIEVAARAAWSTDRGLLIAEGVVSALRAEKMILPAPAVVERAAIAGRARARKRKAEALLTDISEAQLIKLEALTVIDQSLESTRLAWLRTMPRTPQSGQRGSTGRPSTFSEEGWDRGDGQVAHP